MKYMNYSFPAIRGEQAKSEYYACMIPLELLSKIFIDTDNDAPAEYRAQRRINESRIPSIKQYVLDNRDSYVFSSLTASIDGNIRFIPSEHKT
jgi:DNA sulfur modification protein DndB